MKNPNIDFYNNNAEKLTDMYNSVQTESVHGHILDLVRPESRILDIGCGSGRDAYYLANKGHTVVAVDPAKELLEKAKENFKHNNLIFIEDKLPELNNIKSKYDYILMSAIWMHIPLEQREESAKKIMSLLKPSGKAFISLRHGAFNDEREEMPVSSKEIELFTENSKKYKASLLEENTKDKFNRGKVYWQTVILENTEEPKLSLKDKKKALK